MTIGASSTANMAGTTDTTGGTGRIERRNFRVMVDSPAG